MTTYIEKTEEDYEKFANELIEKANCLSSYVDKDMMKQDIIIETKYIIKQINNHEEIDEYYCNVIQPISSIIRTNCRHCPHDSGHDIVWDFFKDVVIDNMNDDDPGCWSIIYAPKMTAVKNANV